MNLASRPHWLRWGVAALVALGGGGFLWESPNASPAAQTSLDFAFYRENVEPIFTRARGTFRPPDPGRPACVMCHTWQTHSPLQLERLQESPSGDVSWTEAQSRRNFEVVSRLVLPGDPDNSRLLRKPLAVSAGGTETHVGGKFWRSTDDPEWKVLAEWVRKGAGRTASPPAPRAVDFEFFRACVQPIFVNPYPGAVACTECHGGAFARELPAGRTSWTEEDARAAFQVLARFIVPGEPLQSRFLMHPLHPAAGGDYAHNGVKRWLSQNDPEWQMLAAWVRGERTGNRCEP